MPLDPYQQFPHGPVRGRLIYIAGPSGAGKDTLLQYARERIPAHVRVAFAHRYITRQTQTGQDDDVPLTPSEFVVRSRAGLFAMDWHANGYSYGIGVEINRWLSQGFQVIVNGSRGYVPEARRRYPDLRLIWVGASIGVLTARLSQRGRETAAEIARRVERAIELEMPPHPPDLCLQNDNAPNEAGDQLIAFILGQSATNFAVPAAVEVELD
ncbi:MAG: phosphonate metabolism protein/1,5-bisphosphokinase (PRPP-forming) PhnN [Burkholderiales bacterium]